MHGATMKTVKNTLLFWE